MSGRSWHQLVTILFLVQQVLEATSYCCEAACKDETTEEECSSLDPNESCLAVDHGDCRCIWVSSSFENPNMQCMAEIILPTSNSITIGPVFFTVILPVVGGCCFCCLGCYFFFKYHGSVEDDEDEDSDDDEDDDGERNFGGKIAQKKKPNKSAKQGAINMARRISVAALESYDAMLASPSRNQSIDEGVGGVGGGDRKKNKRGSMFGGSVEDSMGGSRSGKQRRRSSAHEGSSYNKGRRRSSVQSNSSRGKKGGNRFRRMSEAAEASQGDLLSGMTGRTERSPRDDQEQSRSKHDRKRRGSRDDNKFRRISDAAADREMLMGLKTSGKFFGEDDDEIQEGSAKPRRGSVGSGHAPHHLPPPPGAKAKPPSKDDGIEHEKKHDEVAADFPISIKVEKAIPQLQPPARTTEPGSRFRPEGTPAAESGMPDALLSYLMDERSESMPRAQPSAGRWGDDLLPRAQPSFVVRGGAAAGSFQHLGEETEAQEEEPARPSRTSVAAGTKFMT